MTNIPTTEEEIRELFWENREELIGERITVPDPSKEMMNKYYTINGIGDEAIKYHWDHTSKYKWSSSGNFARYENMAENAKNDGWVVPFLKKVVEKVG